MKEESIPAIWWRWLLVVCVVVAVFGLMLAIAPGVFHSTLGQITYNSFFEHDAYAALSAGELTYQDWLMGVLGATMAGWLVMMGWLVAGPFRRGERWAWTAITLGMIVWFVLDTGTSLAHGVVFNAISNLGFLFGFGIPLVATYRHFHKA
jgi:hypothetical protein